MPDSVSTRGNYLPGISVKLSFEPSTASYSPITIEDNVFGREMIIGPYPAQVKLQNNTFGELTVKHGLG